MPTTLLTGSNGFVGATVLSTLLSSGHIVIAPVRSITSGEALLSIHPEWPSSKVKFVQLPDLTVPGAFENIFKEHSEIDYIVHVAAPVLDNPANVDFVENYEKPSVLGNRNLLESAKHYGKNVKAVAITGSINAITTLDLADLEARVMGPSEWLPLDKEEAVQMQNPYISYCVGKKLAEKAVWDFVAREKPHFWVTNFCPPLIFGPPLQVIKDVTHPNFSTGQIWSIFDGSNEVVPPTMAPGYIDVRDLADLHIKALTTPGAANKRFVVGHTMMYQDFADVLKEMPELKLTLPKENDEARKPLKLETSEADEVFGSSYRSIKETARDSAMVYLKMTGKA